MQTELAAIKRSFTEGTVPWLAKQRECCVTRARFGDFALEFCANTIAMHLGLAYRAWGHAYLDLSDFFTAGKAAVKRAYIRCVSRDWIECVQVAALTLILHNGKRHRAYLLEEVDAQVKRRDFEEVPVWVPRVMR